MSEILDRIFKMPAMLSIILDSIFHNTCERYAAVLKGPNLITNFHLP